MSPFDESDCEDEFGYIHLLCIVRSLEDRPRLIAGLDKMPVRYYPFHKRWLLIHHVAPFHCWSDDGYDPLRSNVPRDIQLLAATGYGMADIYNGGLHQFFSNGTGVFAPEMCEWFERAGFTTSSSVLWEAIKVFGDNYPRSQVARNAFLDTFEGDERSEWDPFDELENRFYQFEHDEFDAAADRWLRDVCGIKTLFDELQ